mgnify:CR=1 FL=1
MSKSIALTVAAAFGALAVSSTAAQAQFGGSSSYNAMRCQSVARMPNAYSLSDRNACGIRPDTSTAMGRMQERQLQTQRQWDINSGRRNEAAETAECQQALAQYKIYGNGGITDGVYIKYADGRCVKR